MSDKEKVYQFKVSLLIPRQKIYREMALKGSSSLREFAKTITAAFNFKLDHSFGFFNNLKDFYESTEAYTSFYDNGSPMQPNEKSVKNSYVCDVFEPGKKMHFHFDFGDDWEFLVECRNVIEAEEGKNYPVVTKKVGEGPSQYPEPESYSETDDDDE